MTHMIGLKGVAACVILTSLLQWKGFDKENETCKHISTDCDSDSKIGMTIKEYGST